MWPILILLTSLEIEPWLIVSFYRFTLTLAARRFRISSNKMRIQILRALEYSTHEHCYRELQQRTECVVFVMIYLRRLMAQIFTTRKLVKH